MVAEAVETLLEKLRVRGATYERAEHTTFHPGRSARLLVGALAHPLNRAVYDEASSRVRGSREMRSEAVASSMPEPVSLITFDVSFISLTLILPPAMQLLRPDGVLIPLIKPQFELRREEVGRGGVVRDPELHQRAVSKIEGFVREELKRAWVGCVPSPIRGGEGNQEFLACVRNVSA